MTPVSITSTVDESKILTEDYAQAKTWTVVFKVSGANGEHAYDVKAANGNGSSAALTVTINTPVIVSIAVESMPYKTKYTVGQKLNTNGLELLVTYSDGSKAIVESGYTTDVTVLNNRGVQKVTVTYENHETTFNVNVWYSFIQIIIKLFSFSWLIK